MSHHLTRNTVPSGGWLTGTESRITVMKGEEKEEWELLLNCLRWREVLGRDRGNYCKTLNIHNNAAVLSIWNWQVCGMCILNTALKIKADNIFHHYQSGKTKIFHRISLKNIFRTRFPVPRGQEPEWPVPLTVSHSRLCTKVCTEVNARLQERGSPRQSLPRLQSCRVTFWEDTCCRLQGKRQGPPRAFYLPSTFCKRLPLS